MHLRRKHIQVKCFFLSWRFFSLGNFAKSFCENSCPPKCTRDEFEKTLSADLDSCTGFSYGHFFLQALGNHLREIDRAKEREKGGERDRGEQWKPCLSLPVKRQFPIVRQPSVVLFRHWKRERGKGCGGGVSHARVRDSHNYFYQRFNSVCCAAIQALLELGKGY